MSNLDKMRELIEKLLEASKSYYQKDKEIMSNYEYDKYYDLLVEIEKKTDIVMANSPTNKVGYNILSQLPKEKHSTRMLSLDKTKDREVLKTWLGDEEGLLSWKLDGLTIVLTYEDGMLIKGVTRGNGEVGEVITNNVKVFDNVPLKIPIKDRVVIRGEAVIKYTDFNKINESLVDEEYYKNPRNLCSGSVRQLNNEVTAKRHINFYGFQVVSSNRVNCNFKAELLNWLESIGFDVVPRVLVTKKNLLSKVDEFSDKMPSSDIASDGLVLTFDDISYSKELGTTSKFPKDSIAFKWQDEVKETILLGVEWQTSRTGRMNPVAIFEPVTLEGSTISRASLHNLSIMEELELGIGDKIQVYKANMIIPQVAKNLTKSGSVKPPKVCQVCGYTAEIREEKTVKTLYCNNPICGAKSIKELVHYVSRDAMNIDGLSEASIEKLVNSGYINTFSDFYRLEKYKDMIIEMEGFGKKSYKRLIHAIEVKRHISEPRFIYALGIPNVGVSNAKLLCSYYNYDMRKILEANEEDLISIDGFGQVISKSIYDYFHNSTRLKIVEELLKYISFELVEENNLKQVLTNEIIVITGGLKHYENRKTLSLFIESLGGKVTGSVTRKTTYLLNNDIKSTSGKNKKANELGIEIINEERLIEIIKKRQGA